jgi:protein pelota
MGGDRAQQVRKPMTLTIEVTAASLEHNILRVQGIITEGPEDLVSVGEHHSMTVEVATQLDLIKEWDAVSRQRLQEAAKAKPLDVLVVVFDRESAEMAELTRRGYEMVQSLTGEVTKKAPGGGSENFFAKLAQAIAERDNRQGYNSIVAASPAFWTEYLLKELPVAQAKKTVTATCSSVGEAGVREVLKRPEVDRALAQDRSAREERLMHQVLEAVGQNKACYGEHDCTEKAALGQVQLLVMSASLIERSREEGFYTRLDNLLEQVRGTGAEVAILQMVTEQLNSLGGVAGVLRW